MTDFEQIETGDRTVRAYVRIPEGSTAGVVVLHAWWGLNDDVVAFADRLADAGYGVLAPDMFNGQVTAEISEADRLSNEGDASHPDVVVFNAVDRLAERLPPGAPLATLGFSFGAAYGLWAPSERSALRASVVYYGAWADKWVSGSSAPMLGHFADEDPYTSAEEVSEVATAFRAAGREATTHFYPGTHHWFAEPSRPEYNADAAELAFARTLEFLGRELASGR